MTARFEVVIEAGRRADDRGAQLWQLWQIDSHGIREQLLGSGTASGWYGAKTDAMAAAATSLAEPVEAA